MYTKNVHKFNLVVFLYVSFMLSTYSLDRFFPHIRLGEIVYFNIFRIALLIGWQFIFFRICLTKRIDFSLNKQDALLLLFYFSLMLSLIWSVNERETIRGLYNTFYLMLFYFILIIILRNKKALFAMNYYFLISPIFYFAVSYFIFATYSTLRLSSYIHGDDFFIISSFSNYVASSVEIAVPFLYSMIIIGKKKVKIVAILSLLCILLVLLLSESRGSFIIINLMTIIYFVLCFRKKGLILKKVILVPILIFIVYSIFSFSVYEEIRGHFEERFVDLSHVSQESRYELYKANIQMIENKWLLGWGWGYRIHDLILYKYNLLCYRERGYASHNFIVTIWTGAGIFSLFIFFYLIIYVLKKFKPNVFSRKIRVYREDLFIVSIYVSFIGTIMHGFLRPLLDNPNFYFLLALASVTIKRIEDSSYLNLKRAGI